MAAKFKLIPLDIVSFVLTILALILHNVGFFVHPWWRHESATRGTSYMGMTTLRLCQVSCVDKTVLDIEGGREWILMVRVLEVFGDIFVFLAMLFAILMVTLRTRPIHTALVYIHGAAAMFIWLGVFVFLGFQSTLNKGLTGEGSVQYPFGLCLLGGLCCIGASIVIGFALSKHLLEWAEDDDDDEELQGEVVNVD